MHNEVSQSQPHRAGFIGSFDREYIERLKQGDAATERHFTKYFGDLLRIKLSARINSADLIEDLRQETFLRVLTALRRKDSLKCPERLGGFVNSVCQNLLNEMYRSKSRNECGGTEEVEVPDGGASAEEALVSEEQKRQVRRVLADLPGKDRDLLQMVFYEEADKDHICRLFHVDREHLRVLIHRAKARLRKELLDRHGERFYAQ